MSAADDELLNALAEARRAWPTVDVEATVFLDHLRERLPEGPDRLPALRQLHVADLYLACACARGEPAAMALFERESMAPAARALARIESAPSFVAHVRRRLHERLFSGTRPHINDYAGRGPLDGWLRVAATRLALEEQRHFAPHAAPAPPVLGAEPDLDAIRRRDAGDALRALERALADLAPADRELLRLHYVEGVPVSRLGELQGCDEATASRRLADARRQLLAETRRELEKHVSRRTEAYREDAVNELEGRLQASLTMVLQRPK